LYCARLLRARARRGLETGVCLVRLRRDIVLRPLGVHMKIRQRCQGVGGRYRSGNGRRMIDVISLRLLGRARAVPLRLAVLDDGTVWRPLFLQSGTSFKFPRERAAGCDRQPQPGAIRCEGCGSIYGRSGRHGSGKCRLTAMLNGQFSQSDRFRQPVLGL